MRSFLRAVALRSVLVASVVWASLPARAAADEWVPALSTQTGATYTRSPGFDTNDYFVAATPSLGYFFGTERVQVGVTYAFTGSLNSELPNGIANRGALTLAYDVGPVTRLLFGFEALHASIGNYLLVRRAPQSQVGGIPNLNTTLLTLTGTQGIEHEFTSTVRLSQSLAGSYVTSLDDVVFRNYLASSTVGIAKGYEFDALGGELIAQYSRTFLPDARILNTVYTVSLGPTWDHDFSRTISGSFSVAGAIAFSPSANTDPRVTPAGRASLLYSNEGSGIELSYAGGFEPNLLLGTLLQSQTVQLRGFTPIWEEKRIIFGVSAAYLQAKTLDLREDSSNANEFDAVLHDAEISWSPLDFMSTFLRYQFIGQTAGTGPGATPPLVRHGVVLGIDLFGGGRPNARPRVQTRFPQRVDQKDAPPPENRRR